MNKPIIPEGYILLPRAKHPIDDMPSLYRDVWLYILKKASHKDDATKGYVRGECLISIPELQKALTYYVGFKKVTPTKHQIDNVFRWLRKINTYASLYDNGYDANTPMITTTKTTRGMVVKVHDYAFLQDPKNYEYDTGNDNENDTSTKRVRQQPDTIYKNDKELKNDKKNINSNEISLADLEKVADYYQTVIKPLNHNEYNELQQDCEQYGLSIVCKVIQEAGKRGVSGYKDPYKWITATLIDWNKQGLKTIEQIDQYLQTRPVFKPKNATKKQEQRRTTPLTPEEIADTWI